METEKDMQWYEYVRKRPGMYIGCINEKAFVDLLKRIISLSVESSSANRFSIELKDDLEAKFSFINQKNEIETNWSVLKNEPIDFILLDLFVLNALSEKFRISFFNAKQEPLEEQYYEKGILIKGKKTEVIKCSVIEVEFVLDKEIWGKDFKWNKPYFSHQLRAFAYLHRKTKFEIKYKEDGENCRMIYHFRNGLKDRIEIEILNGLGASYFETYIDTTIGNIHLEAAFAFRSYSIDAPYLKSYVNDFLSFKHGTHVDGLMKGLVNAIIKYLEKNKLADEYRLTEKSVEENLIAAINITMDEPVFSGSTKSKLANLEVVEPIANYVTTLLFKKIEEDEKAIQGLIQAYRI